MLWLLHQFENFSFKYVRKFGEHLLKILGDNSSLGSVGVKNATIAIIQNIFSFIFFSLHVIALLLAIKNHSFELPVLEVHSLDTRTGQQFLNETSIFSFAW